MAVAKFIGVHHTEFYAWLNFGKVPAFRRKRKGSRDWNVVEVKLYELTGATLDEIFPLELESESFKRKDKSWVVTQEVPIAALTGGDQLLLPEYAEAVEREADLKKAGEKICESLESLKPRYRQVIQMRFGLPPYSREHTLEEIGAVLGVIRERVRQIEARALARLREPAFSRQLRPFSSL